MAGFRIANTNFDPTPKIKPVKSKDYLSFIHELPCASTGRYGVQAAHLSMASPRHGHYGRSKGRKAHDRWCLPLCPEEHALQHRIGEEAYWSGRDPHFLCLVIWGLFCDMGRMPRRSLLPSSTNGCFVLRSRGFAKTREN